MSSLLNLLRGTVRVEATGAMPVTLLNLCAARGLAFWDAKAEDSVTVRLTVFKSDLKELEELARRSNVTVQAVRKRGAPFFMRRFRKRYTLIAGFALCIAALFWSSLYIWDIDVSGNEAVPASKILTALENAGVGVGSFWPRFTIESIRSLVLVEVPELSFITVNVSGSRAEIIVRERVPKPELVNESVHAHVIAEKSGIITGMNVYRGSASVLLGQTVLAGEMLVSGEIESPFAGLRGVRAMADVTARTWYELVAVQPLEGTSKSYTGEEKSRIALCIGTKRINFYGNSGICDGNCDKIITEKRLELAGLFTLPVSIVRESCAEYELKPSELDSRLARDEMETELAETLSRILGETGELVDMNFTASESGGLLYVTLRAECIEQIGIQKEFS